MSPLNTPLTRRERVLTALNTAAGGLLTACVEHLPRLSAATGRLAAVVRNLALLLPVLLLGLRLGHRLRAQYREANRLARHGVGVASHRYRLGVTRVTCTWESIRLSLMAEELGSDRYALGLTS